MRVDPLLDAHRFVERVSDQGISLAVFVPVRAYDADAWDFLRFARADLQTPTVRGFVNALSNAKRAVLNRVDTLLYGFGLAVHSKKEGWSYPKKADRLREAGIPVPDVLQNMITSSQTTWSTTTGGPKTPRTCGTGSDRKRSTPDTIQQVRKLRG